MIFSKKVFLYVLYVILIVLIATALIVAFKPKKKTSGPVAQPIGQATKTTQNKTGANKGLSVSQNQNGSRLGTPANPNQSTGTSSTSTTAPNQPATTPSAAAGKNTASNLASTGPKETLAVFATSSILGVMFYRRHLIKKSI